ncbi:hypothetical protein GCM10010218_49480 [Streptomyces mashuensis]|uniref:Uncharacterized protein n=1 Tax=Streptomyces mashuensis TaxID=33904 RepID=A0A919B7U6_9ACTN|nr:hypothetical protein [Streptomyces mashuensis]GHF61952.1 hypothetical protein GCM10010218_49480 [Streptomyces mashuensis]
MTARRPMLTAVAAGTLLCALWFVPNADATDSAHAARTATGAQAPAAPARTAPAAQQQLLADSGSIDTTPYLCGGVAFVAAGGALVTGAVRRSRTAHRQGVAG